MPDKKYKIEKVKLLLENDKIEDAFSNLSEFLIEPKLRQELSICIARYNDLKNRTRSGVISNEEQIKQKNIIRLHLLELINEFASNKSKDIRESEKTKFDHSTSIFFILSIISFIGLIFMLTKNSFDQNSKIPNEENIVDDYADYLFQVHNECSEIDIDLEKCLNDTSLIELKFQLMKKAKNILTKLETFDDNIITDFYVFLKYSDLAYLYRVLGSLVVGEAEKKKFIVKSIAYGEQSIKICELLKSKGEIYVSDHIIDSYACEHIMLNLLFSYGLGMQAEMRLDTNKIISVYNNIPIEFLQIKGYDKDEHIIKISKL